MNAKKKFTPLALSENELFIRSTYTGIHPMVQMADGMYLCHFPEDKNVYLKVNDVIAWHENELKVSDGASGSPQVIESLQRANKQLVK